KMTSVTIDRQEIDSLMGGIFDSVFGTELEPLERESPGKEGSFLTGCIQISGAWEGTVVLRCSRALALRLTATMLAMEEPGEEDVFDALGEVTNLTSGAIQALLPSPTELTPPSVVQGDDYQLVLPRQRVFQNALYACHDEPLSVTIFEVPGDDAVAQENDIELADEGIPQ